MTKKYIYFLEVVRPPMNHKEVDYSFSSLTIQECMDEIIWRFEEYKKSHPNEKYEMHTLEGSFTYRFVILPCKHYGTQQNRVVLTYVISKIKAPDAISPLMTVLT